MTVFSHSQTTNKLVNEAANDSARVSEQDRKIPPALGTNQIAGFGGFRPLARLKKTRRLKSFPWDALVYGSIMAFYLNLEKLGKPERSVML